MVKLALLLSACAMLVSVAVEAQRSPESMCNALAYETLCSSKLRHRPNEHKKNIQVPGFIAMQMFPDDRNKLSKSEEYRFRAEFEKCEPVYVFNLGEAKLGPYKEESSFKISDVLSKRVSFDPSLATLYKHLPRLSTEYSVARGKDFVTMGGVNIQDGEAKRECVVTPGWECVGKLSLYDANDCKVIGKRIRSPTFFPASKNGVPLFQSKWLDVPSA